MPIFVVVRRLLNSAEVKDFIKLNEHLMNVLCMEPTVFHGFDNIATAGVVAPFLIHGQDLLSYRPSKSSTKSSTSYSSKSSYSSSYSSSKKSYKTYDSYDDGYDAIYDDDDYDEDRYDSDPDYAAGVDDAMDELDW